MNRSEYLLYHVIFVLVLSYKHISKDSEFRVFLFDLLEKIIFSESFISLLFNKHLLFQIVKNLTGQNQLLIFTI